MQEPIRVIGRDLMPADIRVGFVRALGWVLDGERITRVEWANNSTYVFIHMGTLCVRHADGQVNSLILRDVDLYATDWRVV